MLGVPKSVAALISGEMRDTAELAPVLNFLRHQLLFSNGDVQQLMRSFRSVPSMLPKGGTRVWGDKATGAPDDWDAGPPLLCLPMLCCAVPTYAVLCCAVLCCAVLCCAVLCWLGSDLLMRCIAMCCLTCL